MSPSNEKPVQNAVKTAAFRAALSLIPHIGGVLDHLFFDTATAMAENNIKNCMEALSNKLEIIEEKLIDKDWFQSEEAAATFKTLYDKVTYEPSNEKVKIMGEVTAILGLYENSKDKHKIQRLQYIGDLSYTQIELLKIINAVKPVLRKIDSGGLTMTLTGTWNTDIATKVQKENPDLLTTYMEDMEILESRNTIRRSTVLGKTPHAPCYQMTEIGKMAAKYLCRAEQIGKSQ